MTANVTGSFGRDVMIAEGGSLDLTPERDHKVFIGRKRDIMWSLDGPISNAISEHNQAQELIAIP